MTNYVYIDGDKIIPLFPRTFYTYSDYLKQVYCYKDVSKKRMCNQLSYEKRYAQLRFPMRYGNI